MYLGLFRPLLARGAVVAASSCMLGSLLYTLPASAASDAYLPTLSQYPAGVGPTAGNGAQPQEIAVGPDGNLWYTDEASGVFKFSPTSLEPLPCSSSSPAVGCEVSANAVAPNDIVAGPDGAMWFTQSAGGNPKGGQSYFPASIGRITTHGSYTSYPVPASARSVPDLDAITVGPDADLWFTESAVNRIGEVTPKAEGPAVHEFALPTGDRLAPGVGSSITSADTIAPGPGGDIWFTEQGSNAIGVMSTSGALLHKFTVPNPNSGPTPLGLAEGPGGTMWFTENTANQVASITAGGKITLYALPAAADGPESIVYGPDGNLWFTEDTGAASIDPSTGKVTLYRAHTSNLGPAGLTVGPDCTSVWFTEPSADRLGRVAAVPNTTGCKAGEVPVPGSPTSAGLAAQAAELLKVAGPGARLCDEVVREDGGTEAFRAGSVDIVDYSDLSSPTLGDVCKARTAVSEREIIAFTAPNMELSTVDSFLGFGLPETNGAITTAQLNQRVQEKAPHFLTGEAALKAPTTSPVSRLAYDYIGVDTARGGALHVYEGLTSSADSTSGAAAFHSWLLSQRSEELSSGDLTQQLRSDSASTKGSARSSGMAVQSSPQDCQFSTGATGLSCMEELTVTATESDELAWNSSLHQSQAVSWDQLVQMLQGSGKPIPSLQVFTLVADVFRANVSNSADDTWYIVGQWQTDPGGTCYPSGVLNPLTTNWQNCGPYLQTRSVSMPAQTVDTKLPQLSTVVPSSATSLQLLGDSPSTTQCNQSSGASVSLGGSSSGPNAGVGFSESTSCPDIKIVDNTAGPGIPVGTADWVEHFSGQGVLQTPAADSMQAFGGGPGSGTVEGADFAIPISNEPTNPSVFGTVSTMDTLAQVGCGNSVLGVPLPFVCNDFLAVNAQLQIAFDPLQSPIFAVCTGSIFNATCATPGAGLTLQAPPGAQLSAWVLATFLLPGFVQVAPISWTATVTGGTSSLVVSTPSGPNSSCSLGFCNLSFDVQPSAVDGTYGVISVSTSPAGAAVNSTLVVRVDVTKAPVVSSVSPSSELLSTPAPVTITGTNLAGNSVAVNFGSFSVAPASVSPGGTQVVASPPPVAQLGVLPVDVTVTVDGATSATTPADLFSYYGLRLPILHCKPGVGPLSVTVGACTL
jgi:virginiamycin B lyase